MNYKSLLDFYAGGGPGENGQGPSSQGVDPVILAQQLQQMGVDVGDTNWLHYPGDPSYQEKLQQLQSLAAQSGTPGVAWSGDGVSQGLTGKDGQTVAGSEVQYSPYKNDDKFIQQALMVALGGYFGGEALAGMGGEAGAAGAFGGAGADGLAAEGAIGGAGGAGIDAGALSGMDLAADAGMAGGSGYAALPGSASGTLGTTGANAMRAGELGGYATNGSLPSSAAIPTGMGSAADTSWLQTAANAVGGPRGIASLLGGLAGASAGKDQLQTQTRDPYGPAQPLINKEIANTAALSDKYRQQPISPLLGQAYGNQLSLIDLINQQAPGLMAGFQANASGANNYDRNNPRRSLIGSSFNPSANPFGLLNPKFGG